MRSGVDRHATSCDSRDGYDACSTGGGYYFGANEITVFQYIMPDDDDYVLQPVATFFLPVTGGTGADLEPGSTLLWMSTRGKVRPLTCVLVACPNIA